VTRTVTRNGALDGPLYQTDLHDTVVEAAEEEKGRHQEGADVDDVQPPLLCHVVQGSHSDANANAKNDQSKDEEDDRPGPGKLRSHTGHFSAVRTPGKGIVEGVEKEGVVAMRTSDPAHPRHLRDRNRCGWRGSQVDDPLTVWSGASDPLGAAFADEKAVARTSHILSARRRISDRGCLIARVALHHVLVLLPRDVDHCLADPAGDHGDTSSLLIRRGELIWPNHGTLTDN